MRSRSRILLTLITLTTSSVIPKLASKSYAASASTSDIIGKVTDETTNKPVANAVVTVTSPNLQGEQTDITGKDGSYSINSIPPGVYIISVEAPGLRKFKLTGVQVLVNRQIRLNAGMLPDTIKNKEIVIRKQVASIIDQGSTTTGNNFTREFMEKVSVARNFSDLAKSTPGAQTDRYGVNFNGTTSPENAVLINGMNTVSGGFGTADFQLPIEFLEQVEIKTGGYMPEYGNATGGIMNVIPKVGGNEFHGTVFNFITPFRARRLAVGNIGEALSTERRFNAIEEFGFEVGGPIIKDKLWFHVGFAPKIASTTAIRHVNRLVDRDNNGEFDRDSKNNPVTESLSAFDKKYSGVAAAFNYTATLTYNVNENHRLTLNSFGNPSFARGNSVYQNGVLLENSASAGNSSTFRELSGTGGWNLNLNYDGKTLNKKLLINAAIGYSRQEDYEKPMNPEGNALRIRYPLANNLSTFVPELKKECDYKYKDSSNGEMVSACNVTNYRTGGVGFFNSYVSDRLTAKANVTWLVNFLNTSHQIKLGLDFQRVSLKSDIGYTGGALLDYFPKGSPRSSDVEGYLEFRRYGYLKDYKKGVSDDNTVYLDSRKNSTAYFNTAVYLQDVWQISDSFTVNGGLRFDYQQMFGGSGPQVFDLKNLSPRVGVIYDPLANGRTKIFASWGRFYQLVPLSMMDRQYPGETYVRAYRPACGELNPLDCPAASNDRRRSTQAKPGDSTPVYQPLGGQYVDQWEIGAEYQILADLMAGIRYTNSRQQRVIEDMSVDSGENYFIGNPGVGKAKFGIYSDPITHLNVRADFPVPERNYDAVSIYLQKSFARNFLGMASYTWSQVSGYAAGLYNPSNGQLNPNINSDFDLVNLLGNRYGLLPNDSTHQFKIDASYFIAVTKKFSIVPNTSMRVTSNSPVSYLGTDVNYGDNEVFLLPRGTAGRLPPIFAWDLGVSAEYQINPKYKLGFRVVVLNLLNRQVITQADEMYTSKGGDAQESVVGGDKSDLKHLKDVSGLPSVLNANFGNALQRQAPLDLRFDIRFSF